MNGVGAGGASIASTRRGRLVHAQVPAKAGKVREAFAAISTAVEGLCVRGRGVGLHRVLVIGLRQVRVVSDEDRGSSGRGSGGGGGGRRNYG